MIPRCFHWVWLGAAPLPDEYRDWIHGWQRLHPGWETQLWTDENRPQLRNEESFQRATVPAQRSDILRYEVVHTFGGVYLDTDMECLKNIEGLLAGIDAFAAEEDEGQIAIGIFGAIPSHPWLTDAITQLPTSMAAHTYIARATGPGYLAAITEGHPEVTIFPHQFFYPYRAHEPSRANGPFPAAYAVHRWHGSWVPPEERFLEDFPIELERELRQLLPEGARVVTLAEGIELDLGDREVLPFVGREDQWGNPEDSASALVELERLRVEGWDWLVVLEDAYWWFDFYDAFMTVVERTAGTTHRGRGFVAYRVAPFETCAAAVS